MVSANRLKIVYKVLKFLILSRNLKFSCATILFLGSNGIGRNFNKVVNRYEDLKYIISILPKNSNILEFGSGFSTIVFNYDKRISEVLTIEENLEYLPKCLKTFKYIISPTKMVHHNKIVTKQHFGLDIFKQKFNFIYIDGPNTISVKSPASNLAPPNIDVFNFLDLKETVIGVDIRQNTVLELYELLMTTHDLYISKYFMNRLGKKQLNKIVFRNSGHLLITSLFVPKAKPHEVVFS
jgi:hypothetical protein